MNAKFQHNEVLWGTTALTPALSPRRGRIVPRLTRCRVSGKSSTTLEQHETANRCSLSSGERVRVRASVRTNFRLRSCSVLFMAMMPLMAALVGCSRGPQLLGTIQTVGGVDALTKECAGLVAGFQDARLDFIDKTNYPPMIAKLSPQIVRIEEQRSFAFVNIQITGGFSHSGLLVSAKPLPSDFTPLRGGGGKWRVWKLADGVFEYRE